jgi:hypothetical protein
MASITTATTRLALVIALVLSASCYKDPDVNKIACRAPEYQCPGGYTCKKVGVDVGRCCKPNDVSCGVVALDGASSDTLADVGQPLWSEAGAPIDGQTDSQQVDVPVADAPVVDVPVADAPVVEAATGGIEVGSTGGAIGVDAATGGTGGAGGAGGSDAAVAQETGKDTGDARLVDLLSPDLATDVPVDSPPDSPGTCPGTQQACTAGGVTTCIAAGACCANSDCAGLCKMCNASHACVAATSQDDPNARCAGTCDGTGTCMSKQGQTCQTVAAGCVGGTTCSPDGVCCDTACGASCMACDLPGFVGTCKPVQSGNPHGSGTRTSCGTDPTCGGSCAGKADGTCSYPSRNCSPGPTCSAGSFVGQSTCSNGACVTPAAVACSSTGCNSTNTACNAACAAGTTACGTSCCPAGQGCCGGACTQLNTASNCGSCGVACTSNQTCGGASGCKNNDGQPCTTNANCINGACSFFYADMDLDGYPDQSAGAFFCSVSPSSNYIPARVDNKWDCCDDAFFVNPANTAFTSTWADGICPLHKWDGNCNGVIEYSFNPPVCIPNGAGSCTMTTRTPGPSDCAVIFGGVCQVDLAGNCSVGFGMGGGTTMGCR